MQDKRLKWPEPHSRSLLGKEKGTLIKKKVVNLQETVFYTGLVMSRTFDLKSLQRESEEIPSISKFQSLQKLPSLQVLRFIMSLSDITIFF